MHLVNFAHGELLTIGAYVIYGMRSNDISWWATIPVAILSAVMLSVLIELVAFRRVRTASAFTLLLTSFAIEILSHAAWRIGVSSTPRRFEAPDIAFKVVEVGPFNIEVWDVVSIAVAVACFIGTAIMLRTTMFGLSIRAASEDFDAARLMGVKANRVISGAFAYAGLLAGIAGAIWLVRRGQADPRMGAEPLLKAVIAAIIGGLGSLPGAVVGGLSLGIAEVYFRSWLPSDLQGLTDSLVFVVIAILFVVRPQGLFNVASAERV
jgi:branched-chain amino acid transport system permease protein